MGTTAPLPLSATLWDLVTRRATLTPDEPVLRDEQGRLLTYAGLRDAAESVAAGLVARGIGESSRVSWQLPTNIEATVLTVALARLGTVQNPIIPILRRREVSFITKQTRCELLVVPGATRSFDHAALAREVAAELGCDVLVLDEEHPEPGPHGLHLPSGDPATLPPPPTGEGEPVRWIFYTSGTTADPKGVQHSDLSASSSSNAYIGYGWMRPGDVIVMPIPLTHIGGVLLLSSALRAQACMALVAAFDPVATPRFAHEVGGSFIAGNVAVFQAYIAAQEAFGPEPLLPRYWVGGNGGAPLPSYMFHRMKEVFGGMGTVTSWGLTEFPAPTVPRSDDPDELRANTEGLPAAGVTLSVVDGDGNDCPPGIEGELRLKGPNMFKGYVDASLDAAALDEQGRLRTGDLGWLEPTGHVHVTGRLKDIIIRNAENISALEVEGVLMSHPAVQDVAVIGLPDDRTGERCCAVVQLAPGYETVTVADLAQHCRAAGLANQKIPEQVELIEAIPRNDLGKIRKQDLRDQYRP